MPFRRTLFLLPLALLALAVGPSAATAPSSVTLAGTFQHLLGCGGDWDPSCTATDLTAVDGVFARTFTIPAGSYEYKAALDHSWNESYGLHGGGANISLSVAATGPVSFYYDPVSHWVADSVNAAIVTAPGSYQHAIGCSGDWQPECLRSWLTDVDGDGIYTFETRSIPVGQYEVKAAINRGWDENYGAGGVRNGPNIPFSVSLPGQRVIFSYDSRTHVLSVIAGHAQDDNVEWNGLRFDSRNTLYRTPQGAVPAGTPVLVRLRTFHDDVSSVTLRDFSVEENAQHLIDMKRVASGVSCYQSSLDDDSCDYWQATLPDAQPDVHWYRFIVRDGTSTAYYADDTAALDGGPGAVSSTPVDQSYALTVYDPSFAVPAWAKNAVVYQIFPDRFRNGDKKNDPPSGTTFYDLKSVLLPWGELPEGYCRNYLGGCPARTKLFPGYKLGDSEGPRGRDFYGGDLRGIRQSLEQLHDAGFNTLYLNPIFWAKSNHRYDTADYKQIDPYLGDLKDFTQLVQQAHGLGMHIILDGVYNHMSSDSPNFDRYHHWPQVGACESTSSQWESWFTFTGGTGPCAAGNYVGWFNFDTIPVLTKSNPDVLSYFVTGDDSVAKYWLRQGSDGWRMDVMGDPSFPDSYWTQFRQVVKATDPDALIVGELWQKDSTTLKFLAGRRADSTMNYRLRDADLGFLTTHGFDGKGLGDSGRVLAPSEFLSRLASQQEDYASPAYFALMNLIDSHDTTRAAWTLAPGGDNDAAAKAAGAAEGKARLRLASLVQYTLPGMPTVYYGDEVGVTGGDDPDNRRTYPWSQAGGKPDSALLAHYTALGALRAATPVLRDGSFVPLLADDAAGTVAFGRKDGSQAAVVALNKSGSSQTLTIPTGRLVPDGTSFTAVFGVGNATGTVVTNPAGTLQVTLAPLSALVLATGQIDLTAPAPPTVKLDGDGPGSASISWAAVDGASSYEVYRSPVSGGGYVQVGTTSGTSFADSGLTNGAPVYYAVRSVDSAGNESDFSNEAAALPHLVIGWANIQWPPSARFTVSVYNSLTVYGQVWIDGATSKPGPTPSLSAQLGYGPGGSDARSDSSWTWLDATFNVDSGNNDEFKGTFTPDRAGSYSYAYRYSTTGGREWVYADLDGIGNGFDPAQEGSLVVDPSSDTTPGPVPGGLHVTSFSPSAIALAWDAVSAPDQYGYEVLRATSAGGPYTKLALVTATSYTDGTVTQGQTYWYAVRSVDTSFNRSASSAPVSQLADLRTVRVTFTVTVPATTDATGRSVHIAGTLDRLDGGLPQWDPGATSLTRVDATHWTITLTGKESTQLEYKYTLGDWDHVEKDTSCGEIGNRQLTLAYGASGTQTAADTVANWRNVAPCGN